MNSEKGHTQQHFGARGKQGSSKLKKRKRTEGERASTAHNFENRGCQAVEKSPLRVRGGPGGSGAPFLISARKGKGNSVRRSS